MRNSIKNRIGSFKISAPSIFPFIYHGILLGISLIPVVTFAASSGLDLVTMKNGDIHHGTVSHPGFTLDTVYGTITIPYGSMAVLKIDTKSETDQIRTQQGDLFSGNISEEDLTVLRIVETELSINIRDISEISFNPAPERQKFQPVPDAVEMANGDRFLGFLQPREMLLKTASSLQILKRSDIRLIDIINNEDGDTLAGIQIGLNTNTTTPLRGELLLKQMDLTTRYGQQLKIPVEKLARLAINVNHRGKQSHPQNNYNGLQYREDRLQDFMRDGTPGPELTVIKGGSYLRGNKKGVGDFDEQPQQQITIQSFAIGTYEITFDLYDLYCAETHCDSPDDQEWGRGRRPVINVTWNDAKEFTHWLSNKTGVTYRLPTDAEWEYAARAGTSSTYWWGDDLGENRANCEECSSLWSGEMSAVVGRFPANSLGLHDTAGNVFEWVEDCWNDTFSGTPSDGSAYLKPECVAHVIRGGAWSFPPKEIRSANRWRDFATRRSDDTGFRVVRELPQR